MNADWKVEFFARMEGADGIVKTLKPRAAGAGLDCLYCDKCLGLSCENHKGLLLETSVEAIQRYTYLSSEFVLSLIHVCLMRTGTYMQAGRWRIAFKISGYTGRYTEAYERECFCSRCLN